LVWLVIVVVEVVGMVIVVWWSLDLAVAIDVATRCVDGW